MSLRLSGKRGYWLALGGGALGVLLLLFLWAIPAHSRAVKAQTAWEDQVNKLERLQKAVDEKKIPSVTALKSLRDYRAWLGNQDQVVRDFFADRASILEAPITGQGEPNPVDFKVKYIQAVKTQMEGLQNRLGFSDPKKAFPAYSWMEGTGIPKPEEYTAVLRGYWTRVILYNNIFLNPAVRVRTVKKFELASVVSLTPEFDAIPVSMDLTLAPENVTKLLERLLAVSRGIPDRPVINLTRMSLRLEPVGQQALCGLELDGNILLIHRDQPATKVEAPKP